jgi:hypothetical protein
MANSDPAPINGKRGECHAKVPLERDIQLRPETIVAVSPTLVARIAGLTEGMDTDQDEEIDGEVDL